jgi:PIN domain nuclease of toxin-antitoxin system
VVFDRAERGEVLIWVPAMALWEAGLLERIGRIRFENSFAHWADSLLAQPGFALVPLDREVITTSLTIIPNTDLFDTAIVATARYKGAPLVTRDGVITESRLVETFW